jgi:hypothetical protein
MIAGAQRGGLTFESWLQTAALQGKSAVDER